VEQTRVDRWLWAVRLCKTRSEATDACRGGHVRIDGRPAKPASPVRAGSRVEVRLHGRNRIVDVSEVIEKRVGAALASGCYVDHSPPPPIRTSAAPPAVRDRGAGRPTKRDRRRLDHLRDDGPLDLPWIEIDGES
jgi:ribosome-associated heat shock protein Hsp15